MKKWFKFLGSLSFAIFLIATLTIVLIVSTLLESAHGTPFAQRFFYQAGWFDVFLSFVFVNILCSALSRWPYKKYHTGFVVTHVGILLLLTGSLLSRLLGTEGQMAITEGGAESRIQTQDYALTLHGPDHRTKTVPLKPGSGKQALATTPHVKISLLDVQYGLSEKSDIVEGKDSDPLNHAIQFTLDSEAIAFHDTLWLVEKNPLDPASARIAMGAAKIELKAKESEIKDETLKKINSPTLLLVKKDTQKEFFIDLPKTTGKDLPLESSGLVLKNIRYYPDARVGEGNKKLVSVSEEPLNPAVEFEIEDANGQKEFHTRFALFPEFDSLHGRNPQKLFNLSVELLMPSSHAANKAQTASLIFYYPGHHWMYVSKSKEGAREGVLEEGKTYETGWKMGFSFHVKKLLEHAVIAKKVEKTAGAAKGPVAARIRVEQEGAQLLDQWVFPDKPLKFETSDGNWVAATGIRMQALPFKLNLRDFRKVDYPGTTNAASYESDVTLEDADEGLTIRKTISMNKPLDYKGYRIFQSSFIQDPEFGESSVFTVAKNPGIWLIYSGSIIMFIGIVLVFYVKSLSSLNHGRKK